MIRLSYLKCTDELSIFRGIAELVVTAAWWYLVLEFREIIDQFETFQRLTIIICDERWEKTWCIEHGD